MISCANRTDDVCSSRRSYEALTPLKISYAPEKYDPQEERQQIRTPAEILDAPKEGTCLDLSVLFCGLCLGFDLLPLLIVIEGHAFVAVSLERGLREWMDFGRREIQHFDRGLIEDPEPLRLLIDQQSYLALECTGFAHSERLHGSEPEKQDRSNGVLTFERCIVAGRKQLEIAARPFRFALDIASLHYQWGLPPFPQVDLEELTQQLTQIAQKYTILAAPGAALLKSDGLSRLNRLLERHALFGGRDRELCSLDAFVTDRKSGYAFVTAKSGFGKTALLAHWVRQLVTREENVAYHFISQVDDHQAEENVALRTLCQQLVAIHRLTGELPGNVAELRSLYPQLLTVPPGDGRRVIVVIDGLDEAEGWKVGADLFPSSLPAGVFLVFSARDTGRDWLTELELKPDQVSLEGLETFGTGEIAHLLRVAGGAAAERAADPSFVKAVFDCSFGDPFFLRYLVEDIRDKPILTIAELETQPRGLVKYLDVWWDQVRQFVGERPVRDFLGYLLVARGRIGRDDLSNISEEDALDGFVFENTLEKLRRFVIGNDEDGYALCHSRFRDYLATTRIKAPEQKPYRDRLISYCAAWKEHRSRYALSHFAGHLDDAGRRDDLLDLLQAQWIQAKWDAFGSYSALLGDFDIACGAFLKEPRNDAAIAGLAIARQTSKELMNSFPTDLLLAWIDHGEIQRVLGSLAGLSDVRGDSAEQLIAVAEALLNTQANYAKDIAALLSRALRLLPVQRSSSKQLETLGAALRVLTSKPSLELPGRSELLEEAETFSMSVEDPALLVTATGLVADAWARRDVDRPHAQRLLDIARERLNRIKFPPDRMFAVARILPALRILDPDSVSKTVANVFEGLEDPFQASSLGIYPLSDLLLDWTAEPTGSMDEMAARIEVLARTAHGKGRGNKSAIVIALCRLGRKEMAAKLIDDSWTEIPVDAAWVVVGAIKELHEAMPLRAKDWIAMTVRFGAPHDYFISTDSDVFVGLAESLAVLAEWDGFKAMVDKFKADTDTKFRADTDAETRCRCIDIAGRHLAADTDVLLTVVQKLAIAPGAADPQKRAACFARAARVLGRTQHTESRNFLGRAVEACLITLPEGGLDNLLALLAIAQHEDGDYIAVEETLKRMEWPSSVVWTLNLLVSATSENRPDLMTRYATLVGERIRAAGDVGNVRYALLAADRVARVAPQAAHELLDAAMEVLRKRREPSSDLVNSWAAAAATLARIDPAEGLKQIDDLITAVEGWLGQGVHLMSRDLIDIARHLSACESVNAGFLAEQEQRLRALFQHFPSPEDRLQLECGFAASLAMRDPDGAVDQLRAQIGKISALAKLPPIAPSLFRLIAELSGELVGPRQWQAQATKVVGEAIVAVSSHRPEAAKRLLGELLGAIQLIDSPNDLAQALANFFGNSSNATVAFQKDSGTGVLAGCRRGC